MSTRKWTYTGNISSFSCERNLRGETIISEIELYDINGRRVAKAQKGLVIMKQVMSDGSIRTIKVVK